MERRQVEEVTIVKAGGSHGLSVIFVDPDIFVAKIVVGGPAACTGKLEMGDKILSVNGIDVRGKGRQVAFAAFKSTKDITKLTVQHSGFREVNIKKKSNEIFGINFMDSDYGFFITQIIPGFVASSPSSGLRVGQRIIGVNGQSLLGASFMEARAKIRSGGNSIRLFVCDTGNEPIGNASQQLDIYQVD